ncbi:MAG: 3'-5' exonuclease, partial [Candidatus Margulisiibacteriota bacterium]
HADIAEEYRRRFRYILVDEYQDTNQLQDHLITMLAKNSNLFIVGDRKQSIYGFRHADEKLLSAKEEEYRQSAKAETIGLQANFRSSPVILDFINALFANLWQEDSQLFSSLAPTRIASPDHTVTRLALPEADLTAVERRFAEADSVAAVIRQAVAEKQLQYNDIAVLFRSLSAVGIYEKALKDANIPYSIVRSGSFYNQQEVIDLNNFLQAVFDPEDDFNLAVVLSSLLVDISDDALFYLINNEKHSLYSGLQNFQADTAIPQMDRAKLGDFCQVFFELIRNRSRLNSVDALKHIISQTCFADVLQLQNKDSEKIGNVEKLLNIALSYTASADASLAGFAQWLDGLVALGPTVKETEVTLEEDLENSVKIFTVHKAKGLEFPLVIIPDLARKPRGGGASSSFNLTSAGSLGCKLPGNLKYYIFQQNARELKAQELAEAKRLFYVACTRAKDHLVFIGEDSIADSPEDNEENPGEVKSPTWGYWLSNFAPATSMKQEFAAGPDHKQRTKPANRSAFHQYYQKLAPIPTDLLPPGSAQEAALLWQRVQPIKPSEEQTLDLSITQLLKYLHCPQYFYLRYILGLSDFWLSPDNTDQPEFEHNFSEVFAEPEIAVQKGADWGNLVHSVLEQYDFQQKPGAQLFWQAPVLANTSAADRKRINNILENFAASQLAELAKTAQSHKEHSFLVKMDRHRLHGKVDLLLRDTTTGSLVIADYKTNAWASGQLPEKIKQSGYDRQMQYYALAAKEIEGRVPEKAVLAFLNIPQEYPVDIDSAVLAKCHTQALDAFSQIAQGDFPKTIDSAKCTNCEYAPHCLKV